MLQNTIVKKLSVDFILRKSEKSDDDKKKHTERRVMKKTTNHAWLKLHACMGSSEEDGKKKREFFKLLECLTSVRLLPVSSCGIATDDSFQQQLHIQHAHVQVSKSFRYFSFYSLDHSSLTIRLEHGRSHGKGSESTKHIRVKWKVGKSFFFALVFRLKPKTPNEVAIKQKIFLTNSPVRFAMPKANHFYYSISPTLIPPVWPWML